MKTAYVHCHSNRLDVRDSFCTIKTDVKEKPLWWHDKGLSFTASGYGSRIPTRYMVKLGASWRRVYCCVYSNSGTLFIGKNLHEGFIVQINEGEA